MDQTIQFAVAVLDEMTFHLQKLGMSQQRIEHAIKHTAANMFGNHYDAALAALAPVPRKRFQPTAQHEYNGI